MLEGKIAMYDQGMIDAFARYNINSRQFNPDNPLHIKILRDNWSQKNDAEMDALYRYFRENNVPRNSNDPNIWVTLRMPDGQLIKNPDFLPHFLNADGYYDDHGNPVGATASYRLPPNLHQFFEDVNTTK